MEAVAQCRELVYVASSRAVTSIAAERTVRVSRGELFSFLCELDNHWRLSDRFEVLQVFGDDDVGGAGALVQVRGPLGLRRTARTAVRRVTPPGSLDGVAHAGESVAHVHWQIESRGPDLSHVSVSVQLRRMGLAEKVLFAAGARLWMRREFERILENLPRAVRQEREGSS